MPRPDSVLTVQQNRAAARKFLPCTSLVSFGFTMDRKDAISVLINCSFMPHTKNKERNANEMKANLESEMAVLMHRRFKQ